MNREPSGTKVIWRHLWLPAAVSLALAAICYLIEYYLEGQHAPGWAVHLAQHLTIALVVSFVLIVTLEYNSRKSAHRLFESFLDELKNYRRNVAEDVFGAVVGRIVPDAIAGEVEEVLRSRTIKTECEYTISFLPPYEGMPSGYCVVRREVLFRVLNLTQEETDFLIASQYASDEDLVSAEWQERPFHLRLEVDNREIKLAENSVTDGTGLVLEYRAKLAPQGSSKVFLRGEEPVRIFSGSSSYIQSTPADGLKVTINNMYPEMIRSAEVRMFHPGREQVEPDTNLNRYVLNRAFLPGQGFEVRWKATSGQEVRRHPN